VTPHILLSEAHYWRALDILDDLCRRGLRSGDDHAVIGAVLRARRLMREMADADEEYPRLLDVGPRGGGGMAQNLPNGQNAPASILRALAGKRPGRGVNRCS